MTGKDSLILAPYNFKEIVIQDDASDSKIFMGFKCIGEDGVIIQEILDIFKEAATYDGEKCDRIQKNVSYRTIVDGGMIFTSSELAKFESMNQNEIL